MAEMTAQQLARQRLANIDVSAFAVKPSTDKRLRENRANFESVADIIAKHINKEQAK